MYVKSAAYVPGVPVLPDWMEEKCETRTDVLSESWKKLRRAAPLFLTHNSRLSGQSYVPPDSGDQEWQHYFFLDILFIVPFQMGVAGAAWATILSQFLSSLFSLLVGLKKFQILHLRREDFHGLRKTMILHLKTGFPMGFQMSVMCIGQLAMQAVVNSLGTAAIVGYTAASKADQVSVLVNNAMMTAISNYVAQNFGAGKRERIRQRSTTIQICS